MAKTIPLDRLRHISKQRALRRPDALKAAGDLPAQRESNVPQALEWPIQS
jgi:hypothetical protein